jgi:transposase-like protein
MDEYPTSQLDFEQKFASEDACIEYLIKIRWPQGPRCPKCQHDKFWRYGTILTCSKCRKNFRILAGTLFQDTHLSLMLWFRAMWFMVSQKFGTNALGLQRTLDISYKTTWYILHKLRWAMVRPGRELLSGTVEVDEAYIGGLAEGTPGRGAEGKALVVLAVELDGTGIGRVRMEQILSSSGANLLGFIEENVEKGSIVITDGWRGYARLENNGYSHIVKPSNIDKKALPHVHKIISLLKRWLLGTLQGAVSREYLDYYLDEYIFRFNRRKSKNRGKLFFRLIQQALQSPPITREDVKLRGHSRDKTLIKDDDNNEDIPEF